MIRSLVLLSVTALLTSGCGITALDPAIGLFELQTVEGAPLPYTVEQDVGAFADITVGRMTLNEDATCEISVTFRDSMNALFVGTSNDLCVWSREGIVVTFVFDEIAGGGTVDGTLIGDLLSVDYDGLRLVLQRS